MEFLRENNGTERTSNGSENSCSCPKLLTTEDFFLHHHHKYHEKHYSKHSNKITVSSLIIQVVSKSALFKALLFSSKNQIFITLAEIR